MTAVNSDTRKVYSKITMPRAWLTIIYTKSWCMIIYEDVLLTLAHYITRTHCETFHHLGIAQIEEKDLHLGNMKYNQKPYVVFPVP